MNNIQLAGFLKKEIRKSQSELVIEDNKAVSVTTNGTTVVSPTSGKDAMETVTITTAVPIPVHETNKTATIDVSEYSAPVEITPSENKDVMDKATVTLTGIPVLEANKTETIDVSEYNEAVEITPSSNKDAMEKTTVTLTNIPVAGAPLYAWKDESDNVAYTKSATPEAEDDCFLSAVTGLADDTIKEVGEGSITITISEEDVEFARYSDGDIEL